MSPRNSKSHLHVQITAALADTPKTVAEVCDWCAATYGVRPVLDSVNAILGADFKYGLVGRTLIRKGGGSTCFRYYALAPKTTAAPEIK